MIEGNFIKVYGLMVC